MSENNLPGRTIEEISASIRAHAASMCMSYIAIGRDLIEAKGKLSHGEWMPWLQDMGFSSSAASNYMRLAREIPPDSMIGALPVSKALALLQQGQRLAHRQRANHAVRRNLPGQPHVIAGRAAGKAHVLEPWHPFPVAQLPLRLDQIAPDGDVAHAHARRVRPDAGADLLDRAPRQIVFTQP